MKLRPYQEAAAEKVIDYAIEHPNGRVLLVLPARGGKTPTAAKIVLYMAHNNGFPALWVAHRRELVEQARDHLVECGIPEEMVGVIMARDRRSNPSAPIQVASVDTLSRREKPPAEVVVTDEAHRDSSDGRRKLRALYPEAFKLGITGTPIRTDGRGLHEDYDTMIVGALPSELIADGYLAVPRIFCPPRKLLPDLNGVRTVAGDFDLGQLQTASDKAALVGNIVTEWQRLAGGRRTIVFPVGVEHSKHIIKRFRAAGIEAKHIDGDTAPTVRRNILLALAEGTVQVVSSVGVLSEGIDMPPVKCVVLARPTKSPALHIQQACRGMTPWNDESPLILDHAGNVLRPGLGLPHADREWPFGATTRAAREAWKKQGPTRRCENCGAVCAAGRASCPECAKPFPTDLVVPGEKDAELVEHRPSADEIAAERARLEAFAVDRSFKDPAGWVAKVIAAKFGEAA